jgi:intracellular sulfur oxidation DsrE/DsrF family protein
VRTALKTLSTTVIKTKKLMMYKAKVAVCSQIRTKHSIQSAHFVEFLNVKPGGT